MYVCIYMYIYVCIYVSICFICVCIAIKKINPVKKKKSQVCNIICVDIGINKLYVLQPLDRRWKL